MTDMRVIKETAVEKNETKECACPMLESIARITAADFDESGEFEYDSAHTVLVCDLIFKLYLRGEYKEAMEVLAAAFVMRNMDRTAELLAVASSGYSEEKGKYYLDQFFQNSDIYETYELGREIYAQEDDDGEDDSDM